MGENSASDDDIILHIPGDVIPVRALLRQHRKLSPDDIDTIKLYFKSNDVIMHNMPVKLVVHCFGIMKGVEMTTKVCLVVTPSAAYVPEIVKTIHRLDPECIVKTCDAIISEYKSIKKAAYANVAVGTSRSVLHLVETGIYFKVDLIFFYSGNEVINDMVANEGDEAEAVLQRLVKELGVFGNKVQVIFFSERPLSLESLRSFKMSFGDAIVISSTDVPEKLTLDGIKKHEYRIVAKEAQAKEICNYTSEALKNSNHVIIYVDFCLSCSGGGCPSCYGDLLHSLQENGISYTQVTCAMNKHDLDKCVNSFLNETCLLVTIRIWARDIIRDVAYKVDIIINCISSTIRHLEYLQSLGPFQNVKTAITFAAIGELVYLNALQRYLPFSFEEKDHLFREINRSDWLARACSRVTNDSRKESIEQDRETMREGHKERSKRKAEAEDSGDGRKNSSYE